MLTSEFPSRWVHLDFHTGPQAPNVGADFDAGEFVSTLKEACVNSITCFSRCHHGHIYHDTRFPARHPNLKRNLLAEQIEACHKADIRVPVYISAGLDMFMFNHDPGLAQIAPDGKTLQGAGTLEPGWVTLCFNSSYIDYLIEQTIEVIDMFDVDGLFFDIIHHDCCCPRCIDLMRRQGLDPREGRDRRRFDDQTLYNFKQRVSDAVHTKKSECPIFFNAGHIDYTIRGSLDCYSHLELESLPSGGWGYDHFGMTGRYARKLGKAWLTHTGRFHTTWGDVGGYKTAAALEYESLRALAMGGAICTGDQLHPSGKIDKATYDLIGHAYKQVEQIDHIISKSDSVPEVAIMWVGAASQPEETEGVITDASERINASDRGAYRMCLEEHLLFDFVDTESDLTRYKLLILPDEVRISDELNEKLQQFLGVGGKIICSCRAGEYANRPGFALPLPLKVQGRPSYLPESIKALGDFGAGVPDAPIVMYEQGLAVTVAGDAEVLAETYRPYFNREANCFCSHQYWPVKGSTSRPAVVKAGSIIYFAHPIFSAYANYAVKHYRQLFANAVDMLLPQRTITCNLPSTAHVELLGTADSMTFSILHYVPENRSTQIPTIEESLPLVNVEATIVTPGAVKEVEVILSGKDVDLSWSATRDDVTITVPAMREGKLFATLKF